MIKSLLFRYQLNRCISKYSQDFSYDHLKKILKMTEKITLDQRDVIKQISAYESISVRYGSIFELYQVLNEYNNQFQDFKSFSPRLGLGLEKRNALDYFTLSQGKYFDSKDSISYLIRESRSLMDKVADTNHEIQELKQYYAKPLLVDSYTVISFYLSKTLTLINLN